MERSKTNCADANPPPHGTTQEASACLREIVRSNRASGEGGTYAVCSSHPSVIEAAIQQALEDRSILHVESTSNQVNQFGGYSGATPVQFADFIRSTAEAAGLPEERILLGGDHLGPFPWNGEPSAAALHKAGDLVRNCVLAGYQKIHLDASMPCADDPKPSLPEETVAQRAAVLCRAAEEATRELPAASPAPVYVIGTEVPTPGGESSETGSPAVTTPGHASRTLEAFQRAFDKFDLSNAWERVIALVVQPGVDFSSNAIFGYHPGKAHSLATALNQHPGKVFEAHSTDYQRPTALTSMVHDHFAILKVGPWLTFAFREAVLALSSIERELFGNVPGHKLSQVREALEAVMLHDPLYWKSYYRGNKEEVRRDLIYSFSDRCRYYWNQPSVQEELRRLHTNLAERPLSLALLSQYLPLEYEAVRAGALVPVAERLIQYHIRQILRVYAAACSARQPIE